MIEDGIRALVDAINELDFAHTIYSCEGHFDRVQKEMFLPTAYVTFSVGAPRRFARLYERLDALDRSTLKADLRLTYDCLLGRYTLSIWPDASLREPSEKRAAVDFAVERLSDVVLDSQGRRSADAAPEEASGSDDGVPCGERVIPCALVIPPEQPVCPFKATTGKGSETLR